MFFSNIFSGSATLSAFELARGYAPAFLGLPSTVVDEDTFEAAKDQAATRALQRLLNGRAPSTVPSTSLEPGTPVLFYYKSTKGNEDDEWKPATIATTDRFHVTVKKATGHASRVAYEDLRLQPRTAFARQFMEGSIEEALIRSPATRDIASAYLCSESDTDRHQRDATMCAADDEPDKPNESDEPLPLQDENGEQLRIDVDVGEQHTADAQNGAAPAAASDMQDGDKVNEAKDEAGAPPMTNAMFADLASAAQVEDAITPQISEAARRDIGTIADSVGSRDPTGESLSSERQRVLRGIHDEIGGLQVTDNAMAFAPSWIVEESAEKEFRDNWADAIELVDPADVPKDANVIRSHSVYKVKTDEEGQLKLKTRIVPHGNRDEGRFGVRRDSSSAELSVIRLLLALATILGFSIWTTDVKGAYMQSGLIDRLIYVRPPRGWKGPRGVLWRLLRLP